jgi:Flp pilus assembly protein TadG
MVVPREDDADHRDERGDAVRRLTRSHPRTRGQALVEFALVIPFFLLVLFGIVDMSRFVYESNALNEVAREAARQGTVAWRPVDCNGLDRVACVKALVQHRITAVGVASTDITVVCYRVPSNGTKPADGAQADTCGATWQGGDLVRVQISTRFSLLTPLIAQFLAPTVNGNATWVTVSG